jgi:hypothetical protein
MGWEDYHLHQFVAGGEAYGVPDPDFGMEIRDEKRVRLNQLTRCEKAKIGYEYDFGDSWEHELLVEKILPRQDGQTYPVCLAGKRACPPEDCGGVWGYADFLEAIGNPKHPEHRAMREWGGEDFDPEAFDLERVNDRLKRLRIR